MKFLEAYRLGSYQHFRTWLEEAWKESGGEVKRDLKIPWVVKQLIGRLGLCFTPKRMPPKMPREQLLVACGGRPENFAWPWCYWYEIVPVMWDCWPKYQVNLPRVLRRLRVRTIFCTSSQTAAYVRAQCPQIKAIWLPEGIKVCLYPMGPQLQERHHDVLCIGRDVGGEIRYRTHAELTSAMRDHKIMICRPRCDTNPKSAGNIETLTQRYWEAMLSGCVIIGRAPQELIEVCGYNPVVEAREEEYGRCIENVLRNLLAYQPLVDKNRAFAVCYADWSKRVCLIRTELGQVKNS